MLKIKKIIHILNFFMFIISCSALAQNRTIRGIVTSSDGVPLMGVNVIEKGTSNGVVSDFDGNYEIQLESISNPLVFTFLGFNTKEVNVGSKSQIDVTLEEDTQDLDEVVIVGYGEIKKSDLTGAVSSVNGEELEDQFFPSVTQALQGRVSGVQVTSNSGEPGGGVSIKIRGVNSILGDNEPLYVINGIPLNITGEAQGERNWVGTNPLSSLNPNDIQSIEILKDASATAIYGSRGANGVVLITTKQAKAGTFQIEATTRMAVQSPGTYYDMMNGIEFARFSNDQARLRNPTLTEQELLDNELLPFRNQDIFNPSPSNATEGTDWVDAITRDAFTRNYQLSMTGGSENFNQLLSFNLDQQEGVVINSKLERFNFRYNSKINFWDRLTIQPDLALNYTKNNRVNTDTRTGTSGVTFLALRINPNIPLEYDDPFDFEGNFIGNPVTDALEKTDVTKNFDVIAGFTTSFKVDDFFTITSRLGLNSRNSKKDMFASSNTSEAERDGGKAITSTLINSNFSSEFFGNYIRDFGPGNLNATLGVAYEDFVSERTFLRLLDFTFNELGSDALQLGSWNGHSSQKTNSTLQSAFTRVNYSIDQGKYLLTFTARYDGSSKFQPGNKWAFFPSGAIAWNLAKENFMDTQNVFSNLKVRLSYGSVGSQAVNPYQTFQTYNLGLATTFDNSLNTATFPSSLANPGLKWETTTTKNLGLNMGFLKNRLRATVDVYDKRTEDLLFNFALPAFTGYTIVTENVGTMSNKGIEVELAANIINSGKFSWDSSLNLSHNNNRIVNMGSNPWLDPGNVAVNNIGYPANRVFPGDRLGNFYAWEVDKLIQLDDFVDFQNGDRTPVLDPDGNPPFLYDGNQNAALPGRWSYVDQLTEDTDGDGIADAGDGSLDNEDRVKVGNAQPDFVFGLSNNIRLGRFDVSIFWQGSVGNDILNATRLLIGTGGGLSTKDYLNNRWTLENQHNNLNYPSGVTGRRPSNIFIEDGSYIRLKNLILKYNIPVNNLKVSAFSIYFTGTDLLTITDYSGADPEVSLFGGSVLQQGIDLNPYPRFKTYALGLNIKI